MIFKYVFLFNKDVNIIVDVVDGEPFCQEIFFFICLTFVKEIWGVSAL